MDDIRIVNLRNVSEAAHSRNLFSRNFSVESKILAKFQKCYLPKIILDNLTKTTEGLVHISRFPAADGRELDET